MHQTGFIAIVGPTNSGKSTLVNALIGEKVTIISKHPQTTYQGIRGVLNRPDYQIIFTDTPGLQNRSGIARLLNRVAERHAGECDEALWMFDVSRRGVVDEIISMEKKIKEWTKTQLPILVLNKVDMIPKFDLLPIIQKIAALNLFSEIIPVSAMKKHNLDRLEQQVVLRLAEGVPMYDKNQTTDRAMGFRIAELIREQVYRTTRQELPYTVFVEVQDEKEFAQRAAEEASGEIEVEEVEVEKPASRVPIYHATLNVDTGSRKGMIIGKNGSLLKLIGTKARAEVEKILGHQICLKIHVKVNEDWRENKNLVHRLLELDG